MPREDIKLTVEAQDTLRRFAKLPAATQEGVFQGLRRGMLMLRESVIAQADLKWRRGNAGLKGRLAQYVKRTSGFASSGIEAAIGFRKTRGFPYELSQEFGAKARPGGAMAIPVTAAARRAGSPRNFPRTLFRPPHSSFLAEPYMRGRGIKAIHYVLIKRLKPRLGFIKTIRGQTAALSAIIEQEAKRELAKV